MVFHMMVIERLIKRWASEFVEDITVTLDAKLGEILLTGLRLKPGTFEHAEHLLGQLGVDLWNTWDKPGNATIFPHAVEITSGFIKHARIKLPMPNPFNGENWKITVDGVEGVVCTLSERRRLQLLKTARSRALQSAERRYAKPETHRGSPERDESLGETIGALKPGDSRASADSFDEFGHHDAQAVDEGMLRPGYMEGLQKRIDAYFKHHLELNFTNTTLRCNIHSDSEYPNAHWDVSVGALSVDLGVGDIELSDELTSQIRMANCAYGREVPEDKKCISEMVGLEFKGISVSIHADDELPPVLGLNFPGRAFQLHLVKRQWEESCRTTTNGHDRIKVTLPDDFTVGMHWHLGGIRVGLLRMLHHIFDGITVAVPDFADWLSTPWPGGWDRSGTHVPREQRRYEDDYPPPLGYTLHPEVINSARSSRSGTKEDMGQQSTGSMRSVGSLGAMKSPTMREVQLLGEEYMHLLTKAFNRSEVAFGQLGPLPDMEREHTRPRPSSPRGLRGWWQYLTQMSTQCTSGCTSPHHRDDELATATQEELLRLHDIEATISVDWLAYWRHRWRSMTSILPQNFDITMRLGDDDMPIGHLPWEPSRRWYVAPWRRHEVTLIGASRILVSLTAGADLVEVMQVSVGKGMKVVMVRDQPADWHIWAKLGSVRIQTDVEEWLDLPQLTATMAWSPTSHLQPSKLELAGLPSDVDNQVPSLCRIRARLERVSIRVCPAVVKRWVPLLGELPSVPEWPELRYFWGEWGYMARPMAYLVEALAIGGVHISIKRDLSNSKSRPRTVAAAQETRSVHPATKAIGCFDVTLGPTMISTGAVFIDRTWAMVGSLQIALRELQVVGIRDKSATNFVYIPTLYLKVDRGGGAPGVTVAVDLHRFNALLAVVPALLTVFTIEAYFNVMWEEAAHMTLALVQLKRLYHVIMEMTWLWPLTFQVTSPEGAPVKIQVADRVQSTVSVIASFALRLVVKNPAHLDDMKRCVRLSLDPCKVELWYYNMTVCQDWEPLLEPWSLAIGLECDAPPQASVSLAILGSPNDNLSLNVTAELLRVARSLAICWWPVLSLLIRRKPRLKELHEFDIAIPMNILNLTGGSVSIKLHHLPQTESDVAIKVQSILRGRIARRKAKGALSRTETKHLVGAGNMTRSDNMERFSENAVGRLRILRPASFESCNVAETQRLHINVINMRALPRRHMAPMLSTGASAEPWAESKSPTSTTSLAPWKCFGKRRATKATPRRTSVGGHFVGPNKVQVVTLEEIKTETFDRTALVDLAKHNIKVMWDTGAGELPLASFVAETILPTRSTRLLVIDSPVRIFNYTDRAVELAFLCHIDCDSMIAVNETMASGCTFRASVLGESQPIEAAVYLAHERSQIHLASQNMWNARSQDQKTAYDMAMHSAKSVLPGGSASDGSWVLPAGCYASVPAVCRTELGGVSFAMRFKGSQEWGPIYGVDSLADDRGLSTYYWEGRGEACRIFTKCRHMRERSTVKDGGKQLYRCDIIIMPLFSVANALPCGLQAKLHSQHGEQVMDIESAKVVHVYTLTTGDVSCFTDLTMQLRFNQDTSKWSKDVTKFYSPLPPAYGHGGGKDVHVKIHFSDGVASSELVVRCGDVCVVSCPVWLVDKSGLKLRCTDNENNSFPFVEPYYLLDSTTADNYLVIDAHSVRELNYKRVVGEGAETTEGDDQEMLLTEASMHQLYAHHKLSLPFTQQDVARVALPKSVSRHTTVVQLTGRGAEWRTVKAFPLGVRWEPVRPPFGAARSPEAYVITVQPHIVCISDTAVKLREMGKEGSECHVQPGTHLPLWFCRSKGARKVCAKFEKSSTFSDGILIDRASVGLHAVAVWDENRQNEDDANPFVFGVLISDEIPGTLMVSFNTEPALLFRNLSADVDDAALLTDHPVGETTGRAVCSSQMTQRLCAHHSTNNMGVRAKTSSMSKPPRCAFRCGPGETAAAGWYRPFQKGANLDDVHVYLGWKTGSSVIAKVGLYSWKEMIFVRPQSHYVGLKKSERKVTGIRLIQQAKSIIVEAFSQPYLNLNGKDSFDLTCGACGEHLPDELLAHFRMAHCHKCHEQLYLPLKIEQQDDDVVEQLSEQLLDVGVWLPLLELKVSLHIPAVSISVCSQQAAPRELMHVSVSNIDIDLGGSLKVSRGVTMAIGGVRVDRQFHSDHCKSTAVVASTIPDGEGEGRGQSLDLSADPLHDFNVCHTQTKNGGRAVPAIHFHVLNVFVTSPTLCLKTLEVDVNHTFEVDLDTDFVNAMFLFGDECLKAVGVECMQLSDLITDKEEVFAFMPPDAILRAAVRHAQAPLSYCLRGYPMAVQTHTFRVGQVNAKIWASLNLFEMELVPKSVARLVRLLTLSEVVNLAAAPILIEEHDFGVQRTSLTGLGLLTLKVYMPELIRIGAHILESSNLAKLVVAPVRVAAWAASSAMSVFSTTLHAHRRGSHGQVEKSQADEAATHHRGRGHFQPLRSHTESKEPAATGLPPIRLPRLLMSKGRLVPYSATHSRLLFAFGTRHAGKQERLDMSSVMLLAELSEHPLTFAILCREQLAVCELKGALAHSDSDVWSLRAARQTEKHFDTVKSTDSSHCTQYPEGTLWGPWNWEQVAAVRVDVSPEESFGGTGEPPTNRYVLQVDLPIGQSLKWNAGLLQDGNMMSIRAISKLMKEEVQNFSFRATA